MSLITDPRLVRFDTLESVAISMELRSQSMTITGGLTTTLYYRYYVPVWVNDTANMVLS